LRSFGGILSCPADFDFFIRCNLITTIKLDHDLLFHNNPFLL
jgi:hypothetical protein